MRRSLTHRQATIVTCALGIAAADQHNLEWLNRVLAGSQSKTPTTVKEVDEIWRHFNRSAGVELEFGQGVNDV